MFEELIPMKKPAISDRFNFLNLVTLSEDKRLDQASQHKIMYIW
jgi:hypothetical protein